MTTLYWVNVLMVIRETVSLEQVYTTQFTTKNSFYRVAAPSLWFYLGHQMQHFFLPTIQTSLWRVDEVVASTAIDGASLIVLFLCEAVDPDRRLFRREAKK